MLFVFVLCAVGAVSGALGTALAGTIETGRHQRSPTELFLNIVTDRTISESSINQLPEGLANIVWNLALNAGSETKSEQIETVKIPSSLDVILINDHNAGHQTRTKAVEVETVKIPSTLDVLVTSVDIPDHQERLNVNHGASKIDVGAFSPFAPEEPAKEEPFPFSDGFQMFDTSSQMVLSFRRQRPLAPQQPAVIPHSQLPDRISVREPVPIAVPQNLPPPPLPDFNRSLRLRVDLTVTNSDFTEAYDIQWHADSGTSYTVVEDGSTVLYRTTLDDGRVQYLENRLESSGGNAVRHCTLSPYLQVPPTGRAFPGLPKMDGFVFTGYTSAEGQPLVERWQLLVVAGPGEGGAAVAESLNFTHEFLVTRQGGNAVPLSYTVVTDSSVLGPASDSYTHRYTLLPAPTAPIRPNLSKNCDILKEFQYDARDTQEDNFSKVISQFDPIKEFLGPARDTKYNYLLVKFKEQFKHEYRDAAEEAVRKTLFIKSSRFVAAGNRHGASFKMEANFMSDRLNDEINHLYGVESLPQNAKEPGVVPFPYSKDELKDISNRLEEEFDWRKLGGVSPVRYQKETCACCWAFAVAGSTEGALFKKTNKLVPLSPQCLVDCGRPYGAHGCDGTWPSFGYDYVQARGLPAWDEYTPYQAKVLECRDSRVPPVTHISGHVNVTANSEAALKVAIKNHAPNVVIIDGLAQSFIFYKSGVLKDKRCGANKETTKGGGVKGLNHAVLAVGWGAKDGPHFILKNTWSAKWGEAGYIRVSPDSCGVLERPSYPLIEEPNIDRQDLRAAARVNEV